MSEDQTVSTEDTTSQSMSDIANSIAKPEDTSQVQAEPAKPADNVGDFTAFANQFAELKQQVEQTSQQTSELASSRQQETLNKEIAEAVGKINESVGGDADMAELYLEKQYRENPDLKKVWDNRFTNPDALDKALDIVGKEWAAKNVNLTDPAVAENQRALRESQKGGATVQVDSEQQERDKMDSGTFMNFARNLAQDG